MKRRTISISLFILMILLLASTGVYLSMQTEDKPITSSQDQQGYVIKKNTAYYRTTMDVSDGNDGYHTVVNDYELKDADTRTFSTIDPYWAKDEDSLFYMGQVVLPEGTTTPIDIASFSLITGLQGVVKDSKAVYIVSPYDTGWTYKIIQEADPVTFTLVEGGSYAKDRKNAYYLELPFEVRKVVGADGQSFAVLGQCAAVEVSRAYYAWDAKSVFAGDKIVQGADRNTFKIVASFDNGPDGMYVAGTYAVDKNHVYKNCGEIMPSGSPTACSATNLKACE